MVFTAVFGVAVQNGVVMVSYINQLRQQGTAMADAVRIGAEHRLRPVLMTALTAVLGLIPLLLADGIGSNVQRPLAAAFLGAFAGSSFGGSIAGDSPRQPKSLGTCVGGAAGK